MNRIFIKWIIFMMVFDNFARPLISESEMFLFLFFKSIIYTDNNVT